MKQSRRIIILLSKSFLSCNECMSQAVYAGRNHYHNIIELEALPLHEIKGHNSLDYAVRFMYIYQLRVT